MKTITVNSVTFGAMYDALNIAYERLVMNNQYGRMPLYGHHR